MNGERAARKLDYPRAGSQRAKVEPKKAEAFDQSGNLSFRGRIVPGVEQHATPALRARIANEHVCAQMIVI